jgi:hypothetical protein
LGGVEGGISNPLDGEKEPGEERESGGRCEKRSEWSLFHGIRRNCEGEEEGGEEEVKVMVEQRKKTETKRMRKRGGGGVGGRDSPPVAKGGLLTNPAINLKIQNPAKLSTNAVGI